MSEYLVLSPLDHDGTHYAIGSTITLDLEAAGPLLDVSTIGQPGTTLPALAGAVAAPVPLGSEFLPAQIRVAPGLIVAQLQVVAAAQVATGLDVTAWNALPVEEREREIVSVLQSMQREAEAKAEADAKGTAPAPGKKSAASKE